MLHTGLVTCGLTPLDKHSKTLLTSPDLDAPKYSPSICKSKRNYIKKSFTIILILCRNFIQENLLNYQFKIFKMQF